MILMNMWLKYIINRRCNTTSSQLQESDEMRLRALKAEQHVKVRTTVGLCNNPVDADPVISGPRNEVRWRGGGGGGMGVFDNTYTVFILLEARRLIEACPHF